MGHAHSCTLDSGANLGIYCYIILGAHVKYYVVEPSYCKPREHFWCSNVMDTMVWRGEKGRQSGFFLVGGMHTFCPARSGTVYIHFSSNYVLHIF